MVNELLSYRISNNPSLKTRVLLSLLFLALALRAEFIKAETVNATGAWNAVSTVNGNNYYSTFTLVQIGNLIYGSALANGSPGVITGSIQDNVITFHSDFPIIAYSSDSTAVIFGNTMVGSFLDSQSTAGSFTAEKIVIALTPTTQIKDPPVVQISGNDILLTLQKFTKVSMGSSRAMLNVPRASLSIRYDISITGAEQIKKNSKKNVIALSDLKPGNYSVTYKASGIKNGKVVFSTKKSPAAFFSISPVS